MPSNTDHLIYTDGACLGNPGPGGWAWLEPASGLNDAGGEALTTNQRMELTAVIKAVGHFDGNLIIRSDSQYLVRCFADRWWRNWRRNGFRNSKGQPVANRDLWEELFSLTLDSDREVRFEWIKGHSKDPYNNQVDVLAREQAIMIKHAT